MITVLGVSGSPRHGSTDALVQAALLGAEAVPDTETEFLSLAGRSIHPCDGCVRCLSAGACVIEDDMQRIYPVLAKVDAIIIGSPVYFGAVTALCKAFLERVQGFGVQEKRLRLKVGGAIATGWSRNGGQEAVQASIHFWCHINDMIPVGMTAPVTQWGPSANPGPSPADLRTDVVPLRMVGDGMLSIETSWLYGRKVATVAHIIDAGRAATGLDLPDRPYGFGGRPGFPSRLYELLPP